MQSNFLKNQSSLTPLIRIQSGFTLIEIAMVLLIVTILLGYTVALFPRQQELKQYRAVEQEMDEIIAAIVGFAQVNGRLPCPAIPNSIGLESGGGGADCGFFGGFVPVNTLGFTGKLNGDSLLLDPWGNPYRYYVSDSDFNGGASGADFVRSGEMQVVGLVDSDLDNYIDLDGMYLICDVGDATLNQLCDAPANPIFGNAAGATGPYAGAPFVLISHGKDWNEAAATGDQLINMGSSTTTALGMGAVPTGNVYLLKDVNAATPETTFVKRLTGFADDFDDVVKWAPPGILFSKMIEAGQLP
jgi:prepilin-type N-terminal cleavage/methylation domain-containing protein